MRFKTSRVLLALVAVFAISAVTAAGASAYTNPILVNSKGEHVSKVKFTGIQAGEGYDFPVVAPLWASTASCEGEKSTG